MISGISGSGVKSPIYNEVPAVASRPAVQYRVPGGEPLLLTHFAIQGKGEVPRLLLAEAGAAYNSLSVTGEEDQADALQWRQRSPNGLLPTVSGLGIPRATPMSQSGSIVRFLAGQLGMAGQTPAEQIAADMLYETANDLGSNKKVVVDYIEGAEKTESHKMPWKLALRIEKMLLRAPSPRDASSALTYGQLQLFHTLTQMNTARSGCIAVVSPSLEVFRAAVAARARVALYLAGPLRFPATSGELGQAGGYNYATGAIARKDMTL